MTDIQRDRLLKRLQEVEDGFTETEKSRICEVLYTASETFLDIDIDLEMALQIYSLVNIGLDPNFDIRSIRL